MMLESLPANTHVFVDASILAPYFTRKDALGRSCAAFLERAAAGELEAVTSIHVVMEVIHRVMVAEAMLHFEIGPRQIVTYLKAHPQAVRVVTQHLYVPSLVYRMGVSIEAPTRTEMYLSRIARAEYGLMANDSLIVAMMHKRRIVHLATNDKDFRQVKDLKVWMPGKRA